MSIETTLVAYVLGQSAITALIGRRFEPVQNAQGTLLPAVSYQQISGPVEYTHDGDGFHSPRFQLTIVGRTYAEITAVCAVLYAALAGVRFTVGGTECVSFVENVMDGLASESGEMGYYVRRMDVVIQN